MADVWRTCTGKWLRKSWEQRGSQAALLLTLSVTRAGLSASSKCEFNHGKHQPEIVHRSSVVGCKRGAALHPVFISRVKGKPFQGKAAEQSWQHLSTAPCPESPKASLWASRGHRSWQAAHTDLRMVRNTAIHVLWFCRQAELLWLLIHIYTV